MDPLVISRLTKSYTLNGKKLHVLKGVSFSVRKGEILGLLGPNGAGKTTLINILTGIVTADSGKVSFFGKEPCEETQNRINAATAYNSLNRNITVWQNLKVYAKIYNVKNANEKIKELLAKFDIADIKDRKMYHLSSGQITRVNICKGLINSPEIVFLDEATAGLDPDIASKVREEIKHLKTTVIFTSHIMSEVENICDRIVFLSKGKILKIDTPQGIKKLVKSNTMVFEFFSMPENSASILEKFKATVKSKNKVFITFKNGKEVHTVIHALITSGFEIRDFHIRRPTLEEVFIKVARGEL